MVNLPKELSEYYAYEEGIRNRILAYIEIDPGSTEVQTYVCKNYLGEDQIPSEEANALDFVERMADLTGAFSCYRGHSSSPTDPVVLQRAMNKIRGLFKLEFKLLCNYCGTPHYQDEITAPER